ncbi:ABC transporter ATP-binding protein [Mycolicibacterium gadium]|uniref:Multidrug ABC transporter ATP-binding protein n=1 Tax=Mycolicibacterium gadium TaxID=1794 RepID=A0A7I7WEB1_MYCGU|nr:ABC transporter ATP-binding protein [Mycolicibacterium gadium]BBZ15896.1 multidrug ABC transporter ATP-binding protein [Mycolicibacterium gadium]
MTIVARRLSRRFGERDAVEGLTFEADRGEVLGLLGPNGAGKTTTMRMLVTTLTPSAGTAQVAGFDVRTSPLRARGRVGYLPEEVPLPREARVCELVRFVADAHGLSRTERQATAGDLLARVGLAGSERRLVGTLSRGQRQRLGLALALLPDPPVVIVDEPTAGLDPEQVAAVRALIRELGERKTVLLSSHQLGEVEALCRRVVVMRAGRRVAFETRDELARRLKTLPRVVVRVEALDRDRLMQLARGLDVEATDGGPAGATLVLRADPNVAPAIASAVIEAGGRLLELRVEEPTLEDLFFQLAGGDRR